jgi:molybdate transport system permease protein
VAFTTAAVVLAQVFVAAPLYLQSATAAFRRLDPTLLVMARSLGATPLRVLWQVAIPLAAPGLAAGAALCWARALGEFGATPMFAGNLEGVTQTLPLAIYTVLASDLAAAQALSLVLVGVALAVLLAARTFGHTSGEGAP